MCSLIKIFYIFLEREHLKNSDNSEWVRMEGRAEYLKPGLASLLFKNAQWKRRASAQTCACLFACLSRQFQFGDRWIRSCEICWRYVSQEFTCCTSFHIHQSTSKVAGIKGSKVAYISCLLDLCFTPSNYSIRHFGTFVLAVDYVQISTAEVLFSPFSFFAVKLWKRWISDRDLEAHIYMNLLGALLHRS